MNDQPSYDSIVVLGPTASGKTRLAVELAAQVGGEILSIDSRMVYKHMNIGTGKDLHEYFHEGRPIPVHLMDLAEPEEGYNLFRFQEAFRKVWTDLEARSITPILCGGSGMYLEAVLNDFQNTFIPTDHAFRETRKEASLEELNKELNSYPPHPLTEKLSADTPKRALRALEMRRWLTHNRLEENAPQKTLRPFVYGIHVDIEMRRKRIEERLMHRLHHGMIEEVQQLKERGLTSAQLERFGLEYFWISKFLDGDTDANNMQENLKIAIQQFAKRQMTYFRKMERQGLTIHWIETKEEAMDLLPECFKNKT